MHFPKTQRCCTADVKKVRTHIKFYICNYCYFIVRRKTSANYYIFEINIIYQLWRVQVKIFSPIIRVFFLILSLPMYMEYSFPVSVTFMGISMVLTVYLYYVIQDVYCIFPFHIFTLSRSTTNHYFVYSMCILIAVTSN